MNHVNWGTCRNPYHYLTINHLHHLTSSMVDGTIPSSRPPPSCDGTKWTFALIACLAKKSSSGVTLKSSKGGCGVPNWEGQHEISNLHRQEAGGSNTILIPKTVWVMRRIGYQKPFHNHRLFTNVPQICSTFRFSPKQASERFTILMFSFSCMTRNRMSPGHVPARRWPCS